MVNCQSSNMSSHFVSSLFADNLLESFKITSSSKYQITDLSTPTSKKILNISKSLTEILIRQVCFLVKKFSFALCNKEGL